MKINKVLLDTCFLIELAKKDAPKHENALEYFNYFNANDIPYYLSPIVVSEYWHNSFVEDFPLENFRQLSFNITNGLLVGKFQRHLYGCNELNNGSDKCSVKDDIKLLTHLLITSDIDCFVTKDSKCITDYIKPLTQFFPVLSKKHIIDINYSINTNLVPQPEIAFPKDNP